MLYNGLTTKEMRVPPLGRKKSLMKHKIHVKQNGKNIKAWWEDGHLASNTSARMKAKLSAKSEAMFHNA